MYDPSVRHLVIFEIQRCCMKNYYHEMAFLCWIAVVPISGSEDGEATMLCFVEIACSFFEPKIPDCPRIWRFSTFDENHRTFFNDWCHRSREIWLVCSIGWNMDAYGQQQHWFARIHFTNLISYQNAPILQEDIPPISSAVSSEGSIHL